MVHSLDMPKPNARHMDGEKVERVMAAQLEAPSKRNAELRRLLSFANATVEPEEYDHRVGEAVREFMELHGPTAARKEFGRLMDRYLVAGAKKEAARNIKVMQSLLDILPVLDNGTSSPTVHYLRVSVAVERDGGGRVHVRLGTPSDLLKLLEGAEAKRFARCQVCHRYFYATRLVASKPPAGCPEHGSAARQSRYRQRKAKN
jgi:hypothetical protein